MKEEIKRIIMENIKSCTDLGQSKKLAEFLPIESADMRYSPLGDNMHPWVWTDTFIEKDAIPCWSLAALLSVLPKEVRLVGSTKDHYWYCECIDAHDSNWYAGFESSDNPVDACYGMIVKLNEQKLL